MFGDNGIIKKTQDAKIKNENSRELETIKMAVASAQSRGRGTLITENLNEELQLAFNNETTVTETLERWYYKTDKDYVIYKDGRVELLSAQIDINANIKTVEFEKIIVDLEVISNAQIEYIRIKNTLNNTFLEYNSINKEKYKLDLDFQIGVDYDIMVYSNEKFYVAKLKIDSTILGGENVTVRNLEDGYYAYGANGKYYYKRLSGDQTFSNSNWGDPCSGTPKNSYSIGELSISENQLLADNTEYLKKMTNTILSISSCENKIFSISLEGYGMEYIRNVAIYNGENDVSNSIIKNNKFSTSALFNDGETYILEIVYEDNHKYKKKIKLDEDIDVEEKMLGGENISVNTKGKWYYIKYGVDTRWKYKWIRGNNIIVSNASMGGDPASGTPKNTYLLDSAEIEEESWME